MIRVQCPRALVAIIAGLPLRLEVADDEAHTLLELVHALDARWPGVTMRLCASGDRLRDHINIFVDGAPATLQMPLHAGAVVRIMTAVSGG